MKKLLKNIIERTPVYFTLRNFVENRRQRKDYIKWKESGRKDPPPHIAKQKILRAYAEKFGLKILVETGTYYGDMVEAMKCYFEQIYSIELSVELYGKAKKRFKNENNIVLINGDSGNEIENIVKKINRPTLFWLDGHYSAGVTARGKKDTPIFEELSHILNAKKNEHVIIIDDARCFGTDSSYPSIQELKRFVNTKNADFKIHVKNDTIRIVPDTINKL